jgi:hypothetical protein
MAKAKADYLEKAEKLEPKERELVFSRMSGKLPKRFEKGKISSDEAIALQLELEDEQLEEWRKRINEIRAKELKHQSE